MRSDGRMRTAMAPIVREPGRPTASACNGQVRPRDETVSTRPSDCAVPPGEARTWIKANASGSSCAGRAATYGATVAAVSPQTRWTSAGRRGATSSSIRRPSPSADRATAAIARAARRADLFRSSALRPRRGAVSFAHAATIGGVAPWTPDPRLHPRFPLVDGGSPLTRLPRFAAALGDRCDIWIKREDLLPLAFGGNKIRSLEYLVGAALAVGADCLVTTGRRWSNHARLTAAAGARAGLEVHLVLSGPPTKPPNPGVVLDELLGATVHHAATADRAERSELLDDVVGELRAGGRKPHVIPTGGGSVTGAIGQVTAALELLAQGRAQDLAFDDVIVPSATGGTQAGLLVGARTGGSQMTIHGVAVVAPDELRAAVTGLVA